MRASLRRCRTLGALEGDPSVAGACPSTSWALASESANGPKQPDSEAQGQGWPWGLPALSLTLGPGPSLATLLQRLRALATSWWERSPRLAGLFNPHGCGYP